MKSIVEMASTIVKAIQQAWERAGKPQEFSVRILEEPETNFLGMTRKPAKIAFLFSEKAVSVTPKTGEATQHSDSGPRKEPYRQSRPRSETPDSHSSERSGERPERDRDRDRDRDSRHGNRPSSQRRGRHYQPRSDQPRSDQPRSDQQRPQHQKSTHERPSYSGPPSQPQPEVGPAREAGHTRPENQQVQESAKKTSRPAGTLFRSSHRTTGGGPSTQQRNSTSNQEPVKDTDTTNKPSSDERN